MIDRNLYENAIDALEMLDLPNTAQFVRDLMAENKQLQEQLTIALKQNANFNVENIQLRLDSGVADWFRNGKDEILELYLKVRETFDDTEYMQGKKDGLRIALALLGMDGLGKGKDE